MYKVFHLTVSNIWLRTFMLVQKSLKYLKKTAKHSLSNSLLEPDRCWHYRQEKPWSQVAWETERLCRGKASLRTQLAKLPRCGFGTVNLPSTCERPLLPWPPGWCCAGSGAGSESRTAGDRSAPGGWKSLLQDPGSWGCTEKRKEWRNFCYTGLPSCFWALCG